MARDGMLPAALKRVDPHTFCPSRGTLLSAAVVSPLAAFLPSHVLWGLVSMGTLVVFLAVAIALMLLRHQQPDRAPGFRVPAYPFTPLASIAACLYLITNLSTTVYAIFALWIALALIFYAAYARHGAARERLVQSQPQGNIAT